MSDYNWCHGPECHTKETQSRIRGSGDDKVLRTIKVRVYSRPSIYNFFCNQSCLHDYLHLHIQAIADIAPRSKALETPIKVVKEKYESTRYEYDSYSDRPQRVPYTATRTTIKSVDNNNG